MSATVNRAFAPATRNLIQSVITVQYGFLVFTPGAWDVTFSDLLAEIGLFANVFGQIASTPNFTTTGSWNNVNFQSIPGSQFVNFEGDAVGSGAYSFSVDIELTDFGLFSFTPWASANLNFTPSLTTNLTSQSPLITFSDCGNLERLYLQETTGTKNGYDADYNFAQMEWGGPSPALLGTSGTPPPAISDLAYTVSVSVNNGIPVIYGIDVPNGGTDTGLYFLNCNTGAWEFYNTVGVDGISGMAFSPAADEVFVVRNVAPTPTIGLVNLMTGNIILPRTIQFNGGTPGILGALAYDSTDDVLYCLDSSNQLWNAPDPFGLNLKEWDLSGTLSQPVSTTALEYDVIRDKLYVTDPAGASPRNIYDLNKAGGFFGTTVTNQRELVASTAGVALAYIVGNQICLPEGTLVNIAGQNAVPIEQLCAGAELEDSNGQPVALRYLVCFETPCREFVRLAPGVLGESTPTTELLVCKGHPLLVDGKEVLPEELVENGHTGVELTMLTEPKRIYTLVTAKRGFVNAAGVPVATWAERAWENFCSNDKQARGMRWHKK